jgi:hypothetical protein
MLGFYLTFIPQSDGTIHCHRYIDKACTKRAKLKPLPQIYTEAGLHPFLSSKDKKAWDEAVKQAGWTRNTATLCKDLDDA